MPVLKDHPPAREHEAECVQCATPLLDRESTCSECGTSVAGVTEWSRVASGRWSELDLRLGGGIRWLILAMGLWVTAALVVVLVGSLDPRAASEVPEWEWILRLGFRVVSLLLAASAAVRLDTAILDVPQWVHHRVSVIGSAWFPCASALVVAAAVPPLIGLGTDHVLTVALRLACALAVVGRCYWLAAQLDTSRRWRATVRAAHAGESSRCVPSGFQHRGRVIGLVLLLVVVMSMAATKPSTARAMDALGDGARLAVIGAGLIWLVLLRFTRAEARRWVHG